jgi:regulator of PEP synthase PpsR (kinase-PPPase family)
MLDAEYFRRIDALNFTMIHDDGQLAGSLEEADVVLVGVSRTSKTPTSIYLANRGVKVANVPIVPGIPPPADLERIKSPLVVGLTASAERIVQLRENRVLSLNAAAHSETYVDKAAIAAEIAFARKLCARHGWPIIDVTRRSIEETAAAILALRDERARAAAPA